MGQSCRIHSFDIKGVEPELNRRKRCYRSADADPRIYTNTRKPQKTGDFIPYYALLFLPAFVTAADIRLALSYIASAHTAHGKAHSEALRYKLE